MKTFIKYFFLLINLNLFANNLDSLKSALTIAKTDSVKASILSELVENADEGEWQKYNISLKQITAKLLLDCKSKNSCDYFKKLFADANSNYAYAFSEIGAADSAIHYYFVSLKIYEELKNEVGIGENYNNLGYVFQQQGEYDKAKSYYQKSLDIFKKLNEPNGLSSCYNNLGYICKVQKKFSDAIDNYEKSKKISEQLNDDVGIATCQNNIGKIQLILHDTLAALKNFETSLKTFEKNNFEEGLTLTTHNIALIYYYWNQNEKALAFSEKAFEYSQKEGKPEQIRDVTSLLYKIYKKANKPELALKMHEIFIAMEDSISNEKNHVAILEQQYKYNNEKEALKHEKQLAIEEEQKQRKNLILISALIVLALVLAFSFWVYKKYQTTNKQKNIIELQKNEVQKQKRIIEEHQNEINDSINYAKRIQNSFMASESEFKNNFDDYFILFKPKDVVSGDFYWAHTVNQKLYLCAADSTGHGIPGAFMSLLNISLLNEALLSRNIENTNEILEFVRKILILGLKPDESGHGGNDGMDCALIKVDTSLKQIQYSGANNALWLIRDGQLLEFNPDKMPVGRSPKSDQNFSLQTISYEKGDIVYLLTDGYPDQFGGAKGKKFMYKPLKELLTRISSLPMTEQKNKLNQEFTLWKGNLDQVDDVCVIGIKL